MAILVLVLAATTSISNKVESVSAQQTPDKDCAFDPSLAKCKPDSNGKCPSGFSLNVNSQCIPNMCPKSFVKHENDETKCFRL